MISLLVFVVIVSVLAFVFGVVTLHDKGCADKEYKELLESGYLESEGAQNEH